MLPWAAILSSLHDAHLYSYIFKIWRARRHSQFLLLIRPDSHSSIIDVGGYPVSWTCYEPVGSQVVCINLHAHNWKPEEAPNHSIRVLIGDGCDLPFDDSSYDISFSNSVIEHVGSFEKQQAFAKEIRRIGKQVWVQTPAKECPIEPHYLAPLVHYLPLNVQKRLLRWITPWGWIQKPDQKEVDEMVNATRLLTYREMVQLFPDCHIIVEKLFWLIPKSYIAIRK